MCSWPRPHRTPQATTTTVHKARQSGATVWSPKILTPPAPSLVTRRPARKTGQPGTTMQSVVPAHVRLAFFTRRTVHKGTILFAVHETARTGPVAPLTPAAQRDRATAGARKTPRCLAAQEAWVEAGLYRLLTMVRGKRQIGTVVVRRSADSTTNRRTKASLGKEQQTQTLIPASPKVTSCNFPLSEKRWMSVYTKTRQNSLTLKLFRRTWNKPENVSVKSRKLRSKRQGQSQRTCLVRYTRVRLCCSNQRARIIKAWSVYGIWQGNTSAVHPPALIPASLKLINESYRFSRGTKEAHHVKQMALWQTTHPA